MAVHSEHSSYREKLLEHLVVGEVLRYLWCQGVTTAESLRPEVDGGGYDPAAVQRRGLLLAPDPASWLRLRDLLLAPDPGR